LKYRPPRVFANARTPRSLAARRGSPERRLVPGSGFLNILLLPGGALACILRRDLPFVDQGGSAGRGLNAGRRRGAGAAAPQSGFLPTPRRCIDARDRTRSSISAPVERRRVLVEEAKAARIPASARRRAGHRVKHRPLPDQQHRASPPRGRAGAPLRAARFLFRYRDAPAGMTSSSGRAAGLILRARTVSAWTPHPPHAAARLSAAASLEARFPQPTPPSRWRRGALACFLPSGIV